MYKQLRRAFWEYVKENLGIYTIVILFFLGGIILGSALVKILAAKQLEELIITVSSFMESLKNDTFSVLQPSELLKVSLQKNILFHFTVWLLGFLWAGFPFVLIVLLLKGVALGFTVAFIIYRSSLKGLVFCLAAILPHNLLLIPAYILASSTAVSLSFLKLKARMDKRNRPDIHKYNREYCYLMFFILILIFLGGLLEAYITPVFMRMAIPFM